MFEKNLQSCRFCHRDVKLTYYCEECGASFCSECLHEETTDYYICQDCESKNIEILSSIGKKRCKQCGKENIIKISQHLRSCPKCHSHQIINIYEKKEELEQKFLELIKDTRSFVKPFSTVINKLYILRQKVKKARDPPIRCFHYPKMEAELLDLFKLIIYLKTTLLEKIDIHFRHFSLNKEYFFDIYAQPNSNIRIIEGILENLLRNYNSINEYISGNIKTLNKNIEKLQKNLIFIQKIHDLFFYHKRFLSLAEKEKPVYAIQAKLANGLNNQDVFKKNKGILFITNLDLSFIHEYGIFKKKKELIFKAPVEDLIKLRERGRIFKKLYLEFAYGKYEFSFPSNALSKVIDYILLARDFNESVIYDFNSAKKLHSFELDLTDLINFIEEGIISFFNIRCQFNRNTSYNLHQNSFESRNSYMQNCNFQNNQMSFASMSNYPQTQEQELIVNNRINNYQQYSNDRRDFQKWNSDYKNRNYYSQNLFNPYRMQNYQPYKFNSSKYDDLRQNFEERNILMKTLEKAQKFGNQIPSHIADSDFNLYNHPSQEDNEIFPGNYVNQQTRNAFYQDYRKNHLSEAFNPVNNLINSKSEHKSKKHSKLLELKRDRYSLKQTLKKLDAKFDKGFITEVDYFRTFKNLQKEIYLIEKKIEQLTRAMKDEDSIRKTGINFDNKIYFT
ncbi:MAG: hypothetical protein ACTSPD_04015 [Promethearchaeota archaeon]